MHEITPLMGKDALYIADRRKKEFAYPIHNHDAYELNFVENANGVRRIVRRRSRSEGKVRLAMMLGTLHPKPISNGTMLRPERPIFLNSLSITKAMRAIYPLSSSIERKKNSVTMIGMKLNTLPTP